MQSLTCAPFPVHTSATATLPALPLNHCGSNLLARSLLGEEILLIILYILLPPPPPQSLETSHQIENEICE